MWWYVFPVSHPVDGSSPSGQYPCILIAHTSNAQCFSAFWPRAGSGLEVKGPQGENAQLVRIWSRWIIYPSSFFRRTVCVLYSSSGPLGVNPVALRCNLLSTFHWFFSSIRFTLLICSLLNITSSKPFYTQRLSHAVFKGTQPKTLGILKISTQNKIPLSVFAWWLFPIIWKTLQQRGIYYLIK